MSEKAPQSFNPADLASNFDNNKAARQQEQVDEYHKDLIEGAGTTSFTEDDRLHINELTRYRTWAEDRKNETVNEYTERTLLESDQHARALSLEWDDAIATNEAIDQAKADYITERNDRIAQDPALRQLKLAAQNILDARNKLVNEATNDNDSNRIDDTTDRFYELWYKYQEEHGEQTNADIISYFADSIDDRTINGSTEQAEVAATEDADDLRQVKESAKFGQTKSRESLDEKDARLAKDIEDLQEQLKHEQAVEAPEITAEAIDPNSEEFFKLTDIDSDMKAYDDEDIASASDSAIDQDAVEPTVGKELEVRENPAAEVVKKTWLNRLTEKFSKKREAKEGEDRKTHSLKVLGGVVIASLLLAGTATLSNHLRNDSDRQIEVPDNNTDDSEQQNGDKQTAPSGNHSAEANDETMQKERKALMESEAWNIPAGGGGEELMKQLGLTANDWYKNDLNLKLYEKFGDTFYYGEGDIRIAKPGEIPESVKQFIINKTNILNR